MSNADKPQQHALDEMYFHCAPGEALVRGLQLMDDGKPWDGSTIYMQTARSFCPVIAEDPEPDDAAKDTE